MATLVAYGSQAIGAAAAGHSNARYELHLPPKLQLAATPGL